MINILTTRITKISIFLFLAICFFYLQTPAQDDAPEKIKSVKTVTGKFIQFIVGDYVHASIKTNNGRTKYFFLDSYDLEYFLAVNRGKIMTFTYQVADTNIAYKRMIIERIKSAKIGQLTFEKWWKILRKKYSVEQIKKKYNPLVDKYTKN